MPFDQPARVEVESAKDHVGWLKAAGPRVDGGPDSVKSEADDVGPAVTREVGDKPGLLRAPTLTSPAHDSSFDGVPAQNAARQLPPTCQKPTQIGCDRSHTPDFASETRSPPRPYDMELTTSLIQTK